MILPDDDEGALELLYRSKVCPAAAAAMELCWEGGIGIAGFGGGGIAFALSWWALECFRWCAGHQGQCQYIPYLLADRWHDYIELSEDGEELRREGEKEEIERVPVRQWLKLLLLLWRGPVSIEYIIWRWRLMAGHHVGLGRVNHARPRKGA